MTISFDTMFGLRKIPRSDYYYQYVFTTAAYEKGQVRVLLLIEFHQRSTPVGLLSKHVHYALSDCSSIACKIQKCKQKLDLYSYWKVFW